MPNRGVWAAPLLTVLYLCSCVGKPTLEESERRKLQHIAEFKKKILQHLKYDRPPDLNRFNRTGFDQSQLDQMIAQVNERNSAVHSSKKIFRNTDNVLNNHKTGRGGSSQPIIITFRTSSWTHESHRTVSAQLSLLKASLTTNSDSYSLYFLKTDGDAYSNEYVSEQSVSSESDWIKFDVKTVLQKHSIGKDLVFGISPTNNSLIDVNIAYSLPKGAAKLELKTFAKNLSRRKRALEPRDCKKSDGEKKCCRYKVHISFKKIGWDDWVLSPQGYDAHYCAGSCPHRYKMAHTFAGIKSMLHLINPSLAPKPHCTATRLSPLTLIHFDENGEMTYTDYPDMVVQECKCS